MKAQLDVYVINLQRCIERREYIAQQLKKHNIQFKFFNGVDGALGQIAQFTQYNEARAIKNYGYVLSTGEIGCFASHYCLWQEIIKRNRPAVIFEDDIKVNNNITAVLSEIALYINQLHLIRLGATYKRQFAVLKNISRLNQLVRFKKGARGTTGYVVSVQGAKQLYKNVRFFDEPVDHYLDHYWRHGLQPYGIMPAPVQQNVKVKSMMADKTKDKTKRSKLLRNLTRFRKSILYGYYNVVFRIIKKHKVFHLIEKRDYIVR